MPSNGPFGKWLSLGQDQGASSGICEDSFRLINTSLRGMIAYREFTQAGFDVHVFERDTHPGGNWHYTEAVPDKAPIPNADISVGDYIPSLPPEDATLPYEEHYYDSEAEDILRTHRAPKPIWSTLHSNAPAVRTLTDCPSHTNFRS